MLPQIAHPHGPVVIISASASFRVKFSCVSILIDQAIALIETQSTLQDSKSSIKELATKASKAAAKARSKKAAARRKSRKP